VNTFTLNMYEFLSYTGLTRRNTVFLIPILVVAPQEYVNTYSTRRLRVSYGDPVASQRGPPRYILRVRVNPNLEVKQYLVKANTSASRCLRWRRARAQTRPRVSAAGLLCQDTDRQIGSDTDRFIYRCVTSASRCLRVKRGPPRYILRLSHAPPLQYLLGLSQG